MPLFQIVMRQTARELLNWWNSIRIFNNYLDNKQILLKPTWLQHRQSEVAGREVCFLSKESVVSGLSSSLKTFSIVRLKSSCWTSINVNNKDQIIAANSETDSAPVAQASLLRQMSKMCHVLLKFSQCSQNVSRMGDPDYSSKGPTSVLWIFRCKPFKQERCHQLL